MIEGLVPLCRGELELKVLDVDSRPDWQERYGLRIPVLLDGDRVVCEGHLDRGAVLALTGAGGTDPGG
jgi:hypothetical protein